MQKRTIAITALGAIAGLAVIGNIVGDEPTEEPAAAVEEAPAPTPEPEPEPEPTPEPEPEPAPAPGPEPVEAPAPPNAEEDLARIVLDAVWRDTDPAAQDDMCLLYTISPAVAWEAFSDGDEGGAISRSIFDEHFSEVC